MILGQPWIKKHGVIIDITNNYLVSWPSYYTYIKAFLFIILSQLILLIKTIVVRIKKNITLQKIITRT